MRFFSVISILVMMFICGQANNVYASTDDSAIKPIVKRAFDTQVQLSEKERSIKEIKKLMEPYFTKKFIPLFLKENLVKTDNGYQTFGSDFSLYYIPFFSYDEKTEVVKDGNYFYIIESINHSQEGPVKYEKDYQGVKLIQENGKWKVNEVLDKVPNKIINKIEGKRTGTTEAIKEKQGYLIKSFSGANENVFLYNPMEASHHRCFYDNTYMRII